MNDAEYEAQRARLIALAERWIQPLGLGWWSIDLAYARDDYQPTDATLNTSIAQCNADWRYAHATITWNMPMLPALSDEKLEQVFVHELMHIFLHECRWMEGQQSDWLAHEERVATTLAKAFLWLRDHLTEQSVPAQSTGLHLVEG